MLVGLDGEGGPLWAVAGLQLGGLLALVPVLVAGPLRHAAVPRSGIPLLLVTALLIAAGDAALAVALASGELATVSRARLEYAEEGVAAIACPKQR